MQNEEIPTWMTENYRYSICFNVSEMKQNIMKFTYI